MSSKLREKSATSSTPVDTSAMANKPSAIFTKYVGKIDVEPKAQSHIHLGEFGTTNPAKGFSIDLGSRPDLLESIVTLITSRGTPKHYELTLHIRNSGEESVSAEVWQL